MAIKFYPTIGLEIHAEFRTKTKMFCNSKNDPDEKRPNVNICPVCMAHPGTLPVINKEAVKHVLRAGYAIGGKIADFTEFDRKNYFYPDIPKGYQITQYKYPLVSGGSINNVLITRIHLEEDTAKSFHRENDGNSYVDFNRAGVPLMELVTEPVIKSAKEAGDFARELQTLLRYLGASEANMEKGEMRVEANISVSADPNKFGTKVEVKNLNSFKAVEKAIEFELARHTKLLEENKGEEIIQETRGWDEFKQVTFSQRKKESSHDYKYFPDPDLPKLWISKVKEFNDLKESLPELPKDKRERFLSNYGLRNEAVELFINERALADFFEKAIAGVKDTKDLVVLTANYITSDIIALIKKAGVTNTDELNEINEQTIRISPESYLALMEMIFKGELSSRGAKDTLAKMYELGGGDAKKIAEELGAIQKSDVGELKKIVAEVLNENPDMVAQYKAGKVAVLQFLMGQAIKKTKGAGNPKILTEVLLEMLK
ncbi:MAG: Aspartyl/glutamyl-tRNA(Asn/Gln) amidotransferase subunit B [Parcubacteria group bacterium GW2011_GWF2_38_76]|nr:MAG: Aspartyl/glutamyl-tRNA(Asn/Gln) amidotransferase subunit B [Parcubacteria group bacterium GW2011_GWF2_38_76]HBM46054.1 Asp-tRNA(Asn)/Glu-tRNA(Gln) amidotransferase subunit GatB [Patescibacteria group bacterium]